MAITIGQDDKKILLIDCDMRKPVIHRRFSLLNASIGEFSLRVTPGNFAGEGGLLQEGFGTPSPYAPNRRLNEKVDQPEDFRDPIVIGSDSRDDDAFVLAADLDLVKTLFERVENRFNDFRLCLNAEAVKIYRHGIAQGGRADLL